jgi:hypothetical protein
MEAEDQTLSSEEAPRRERRSKKKGTKSRRRQDTQQQQQQGGGGGSGPLDQLPLAGDLGNTVGGVTDGVSNTLGGVTGGLGGLTGGQQQGGGGGDAGKDTLRLRLDLNLDIEIQLKARIHGDLELSLLYVTSPCTPRYSRNYYLWPSYLTWLANLQHGIKRCLCFCLQEANRFGAVQKLEHSRYRYCNCDCNRCHLSCSCHDGTHVMLLLVQQFEQQRRRNMVFINDGFFGLFLLDTLLLFWERDKYYHILHTLLLIQRSHVSILAKSTSLQSWTVDVICL